MRKTKCNCEKGMIGTAWTGTHIVTLRCYPYTDTFLQLNKSPYAPTEPPQQSCTETLSSFLSIGYKIETAYSLPNFEVIYVLSKK